MATKGATGSYVDTKNKGVPELLWGVNFCIWSEHLPKMPSSDWACT